MKLDINHYTYELPPGRIATFPMQERDQSRLLVYRAGTVTHDQFYNLENYLPENSTLYFNNTRVIQARLHFEKQSGAVIEVFLFCPVSPSSLLITTMQTTAQCRWKCTIGNLKRWKDGVILTKTVGAIVLQAELTDREEGIVEFRWTAGETFATIVDYFGKTPLPPYLKREPDAEDKTRYQTIYSAEEGAVAAPTAGLHFTERVLESLKRKGVTTQYLTLHVSAGTFQPIKVENAAEHNMHREQVVIHRKNILSLLEDGRFCVAVGTTSMRTLESLYWFGVKLLSDQQADFSISQQDPYTLKGNVSLTDSLHAILSRLDGTGTDELTGETSIYIMPGYRFRVCEGLVTNFHQPNSTLILLVAAFIGEDWRKIYEEALSNGYRFLSYGDSSLLLPRMR